MKNPLTFAGYLTLFMLFAGAAVPSPAAAVGSSFFTTVENLLIKGSNLAMVRTTQAASSRPSCAGASWDHEFAFDPTTTQGRNLMTFLTEAMMGGKMVDLAGTGTCINIGSSQYVEALTYVKVYAQ